MRIASHANKLESNAQVESQNLRSYLKESHSVELVGLATAVAKRVKDKPEFQSLEDFLKGFKPSTKDLHIAKRTLSENLEPMSATKPAISSIVQQIQTFGDAHRSIEKMLDACDQHLTENEIDRLECLHDQLVSEKLKLISIHEKSAPRKLKLVGA